MGLTKIAVTKATDIFQEISKELITFIVLDRKESNQYCDNRILGIDDDDDLSWVTIFINIKNVTLEQIQIWDRRKSEVDASPAMHEVQPGMTRLYFSTYK